MPEGQRRLGVTEAGLVKNGRPLQLSQSDETHFLLLFSIVLRKRNDSVPVSTI